MLEMLKTYTASIDEAVTSNILDTMYFVTIMPQIIYDFENK